MAGVKQGPLAGKRIVVTRAPEQAGAFIAQLQAQGAEVLLMPTVRFEEPEDFAPLDRAIGEPGKFDWIVFTSRNAVRFFVQRVEQLGLPPDARHEMAAHARLAVVGPATADAAREAGFHVEHEAREFRGESLAAELGPRVAGKRVLLPRSDLGNVALPAELRAAGADVTEVIAYRTVAPQRYDAEVIEALHGGEVDVVTLFSPSGFRHLVEAIGLETLQRHSGKMVLAAIGPVVSAAARSQGLAVEIEAPEATAMSLAAAIAAYFPRGARAGVKSP